MITNMARFVMQLMNIVTFVEYRSRFILHSDALAFLYCLLYSIEHVHKEILCRPSLNYIHMRILFEEEAKTKD